MSAAHEPLDELVAGHVLGALEGEDASRFAAHLAAGCTECERAIVEYQEALAGAAADVREAPPARVRHALLERIGEAPARRSHVGQALGWAASVALAAGIGAVVSASWVRARYEVRLEQMASEAAGLFGVDAQGKGRLAVAPLPGGASVDVFAVTLEPAGGVQSPTGAMYLASKKA